jgi:hypothetical protein
LPVIFTAEGWVYGGSSKYQDILEDKEESAVGYRRKLLQYMRQEAKEVY